MPLCWYARGTSPLADGAGSKSGASATDDCQTPTCWRLVATRDMTNSVPVYPSTVREVRYQVKAYRNKRTNDPIKKGEGGYGGGFLAEWAEGVVDFDAVADVHRATAAKHDLERV